MLEQRKFFDVHQLVNMGPQVVICKKRGNESKAGKKRRNNQDEKKLQKLARSRLEEWGDWTAGRQRLISATSASCTLLTFF